MSNISWLASLNQTLTALEENHQPRRVAVVGIGHELRGDDAAGVITARALKQLAGNQSNLLMIEAGIAPENYTSTLRQFAPDLVLLIDAAEMDALPGTVCWLSPEAAAGLSASTHSLPLGMFAQYVHAELDCDVVVIGIQPVQLEIGQALSPVVRQAVGSLVEGLRAVFAASDR
jgi:hydrogenase 3 maturation protease